MKQINKLYSYIAEVKHKSICIPLNIYDVDVRIAFSSHI